MSEIEALVKEYERFVRLPWDHKLAGPQKVWLAVYDPGQERRLRPRLPAFESATLSAGHGWLLLDLTDAFAEWMARHEYRDEYFKQPEDMDLALWEHGGQLAILRARCSRSSSTFGSEMTVHQRQARSPDGPNAPLR
jgi:hypothetical protein